MRPHSVKSKVFHYLKGLHTQMKNIGAACFALRLPKSTRHAAAEIAKGDGLSLNQFIAIAVVEKIVRLQSMMDADSQSEVSVASLKASYP